MSRAPLVLAIEPDLRQAAIVKRVVKERVHADVVVVDSRDAALAAITAAVPDVVLVSMLLSPRDEADLIEHLRTLEGGAHLQTHTIPQLASALGREDEGGGLFSSFRRKKPAASSPAGCDPDLFADEIRLYLQRAEEKKREAAETGAVTPRAALGRRPAETAPAPVEEAPAPAAGSAWASPFEWRPTSARSVAAPPAEPPPPPAPPIAPLAEIVNAEPPIAVQPSVILDPPSPILARESSIADPVFSIPEPEPLVTDRKSLIPEPEALIADPGSRIPDPEYLTPDPEPLIRDPEPLVRDPEPLIADSRYRIPDPPRPVHTPAPLSVWARKEAPKSDPSTVDAEFAALFARLGVPDGVASVAYPAGVRIRRVRVRKAKDSHPSLHGAMLLGKRMLAELKGSDAGA